MQGFYTELTVLVPFTASSFFSAKPASCQQSLLSLIRNFLSVFRLAFHSFTLASFIYQASLAGDYALLSLSFVFDPVVCPDIGFKLQKFYLAQLTPQSLG
jgi:hypothetical protein